MTHFIQKCSCGKIIAQCRCPDQNKSVQIVQNGCEHCKIGTANDYFGSILHLYDKQQDLQKEINLLIDKARLAPDYEEYKESIESYHTI
jgi:translation elongation factor EF-4